MVQLRVQRGLLIAALSLISRSTFSFMRLCRWASPPGARTPTRFLPHFCSQASLPTGVLFWPFPPWPRSVEHSNHPPGPEIDLLFGRHRGGIRDDRLHDCLLRVSRCVSLLAI